MAGRPLVAFTGFLPLETDGQRGWLTGSASGLGQARTEASRRGGVQSEAGRGQQLEDSRGLRAGVGGPSLALGEAIGSWHRPALEGTSWRRPHLLPRLTHSRRYVTGDPSGPPSPLAPPGGLAG